MGGAPVIAGTRIETTFVAHVARDTDVDGVAQLVRPGKETLTPEVQLSILSPLAGDRSKGLRATTHGSRVRVPQHNSARSIGIGSTR
jgi:hypothetical protein